MNSTNDLGLTCYGLCKNYPAKNGPITALKDVNFHVRDKEFVCIVGPSGCGKTTLLKLIAGLLDPTSGQIFFQSKFTGGHFQKRPGLPGAWTLPLDDRAGQCGFWVRDERKRKERTAGAFHVPLSRR